MLDVRTFLVVLSSSDLLMAFLIFAYWTGHRRDRVLRQFFISKCLFAFTWIFYLFVRNSDKVSILWMVNTLLFIGAYLEITAFLKLIHCYRRLMRRLYLLLLGAGLATFLWILRMDQQSDILLAYFSAGFGSFVVAPAFYLRKKRKDSPLIRVMSFFFLIIVVCSGTIACLDVLRNMSLIALRPEWMRVISLFGIYLGFFLSNTGFIMIQNEMVALKLTRQATIDYLTQALNRRAFFERTVKHLQRCKRTHAPLSFLLFDIDNFKAVNDTYGHEIGDLVLKDLANRIYSLISGEMIFSRFGGDEFCLLLPGADEAMSGIFAEKMRETVSHAIIRMENGTLSYSISIGLLTLMPDAETTIESLYVSCDAALYEAKRNGKNKVFRGHYEAAATLDDALIELKE